MRRPSPTVERLLAAACLAAAFLVMASVFAPDFTEASAPPQHGAAAPPRTTGAPPRPEPATAPAAPAARSLGTLVDDAYRVEILAGLDGPRYTVFDANGRELATALTAEEAATLFPELPIPSMDTGSGTQLMLAEPVGAGDSWMGW